MTPAATRRRRVVHVYVHGRGQGHATRSEAIVRALVAQNYDVTVYGGDEAVGFLEGQVERFVRVRSLPPRPSIDGARIFARRVADSVRTTFRSAPDFIVTDGDHPAVLAGRIWGCPVIAVGHGLVFSQCERPPRLPAAPWLREALKASASSWPATEFVPVNFVPLPCRRRDTVLARPVLDDQIRHLQAVRTPGPGRRILAYFRYGDPRDIIPIIERLTHAHDQIILFSRRPEDQVLASERVELRPLGRPEFLEELRKADVVVSSAGSQLISECVALKKPLFALFLHDHDEQRLNLGMLKAMGAGDGCSFDEVTKDKLADFLASPPEGTNELWNWDAPDAAEAVLLALERHQ